MSNIAWTPALDDDVGEVLRDVGMQGIEIAPTTVWPRPLEVDPSELDEYRRVWERRGFPIVALQALLFGRDDLRLFEAGAEGRERLLRYLKGIMDLGARLGTQVLVFGSPKARRRGDLPVERAMHVAKGFFQDAGQAALERGQCLCIEANPPDYGADFIVNASEAIALVAGVDHLGFRLHLDTACMYLAGDNSADSISAGKRLLRHYHVSEPNLGPVGEPGSPIDHWTAGNTLRRIGYQGYVSVEMRAIAPEKQVDAVRRAATFARGTYG